MQASNTITVRREPGAFTRSLVALLLRGGLGMSFLMFGLAKFQAKNAGTYPAMITDMFAKSPLPPDMVKLFADVLPYAEVGLGGLLIAGLFTTLSATLAGLLLLNLTFGKLVLNDIPAIPSMLTYLLVDVAVVWVSPVTSNYLSLDGLVFGWFWKPRSEGEFVREGSDSAAPGRRLF